MAIYNDLADFAEAGWDKAAYDNRKLYIKGTHRLWRAIMELSLWTADYYLAKLNNPNSTQSVNSLAAPLQIVLESYIDFLGTQSSRGSTDVVPDFAYFGAAEAAEKLAFTYHKLNGYSLDDSAYNRWLYHRLQATELFPMSPREVTQTAAVLRQDGRYNIFQEYFQPLASRIKQSPAIKNWIDNHKPEETAVMRDYINQIEQIYSATGSDATAKASNGASFVTAFQQLREEMQRKPDHPMHRLLKDLYAEEMQKNTPYTQLIKDPKLLRLGL
jgi:hypothetical protein